MSALKDVKLIYPHENNVPARMSGERDTAIADLISESSFQPLNDDNGPYCLELSICNKHLVLQIKNSDDKNLPAFMLSLNPYRRIVKDYFLIIEAYEKARAEGIHGRLEPIDMARRALHNEAAELLKDRLADKITMDHETARKLFTLICVLHMDQPRLWR